MFRVAQVGEISLILRDECEAKPSTVAQIIITVDGDRAVYPVILREGISHNLVMFVDDETCDVTFL